MSARQPTLMRPLVVLALPGMYLLYKYNQYRQQQMETARRRVTERELMHLNTKISTKCGFYLSRSNQKYHKIESVNIRGYAKKPKKPVNDDNSCECCECEPKKKKEPLCTEPCKRRRTEKDDGILHRIKMRVIEGGTNFGTPFRRLTCTESKTKTKEEKVPVPVDSKNQTLPEKTEKDEKRGKAKRPGAQVSILGADTSVGQYVSLLLKQCPAVKQLRLYEATDTSTSFPNRDICQVVHDLQHIDTNCEIQAFSYHYCQLERCLQQTDIVLMLESNCVSVDMPLQERFLTQAPIVKGYSDAIATQCPEAFVIVCASPIDCMVPLVAETLRDACCYDCRKVMGSMAVPEMRASTLAARALCLEPRYTRVPCVGGTEGDTLVPLFSRAVEYFTFNKYNTDMLTQSVRQTTAAIGSTDKDKKKTADLSEAHALSKLVAHVAHALLCQDVPRISAFVETHAGHVVSPARFIANTVELNHKGVLKNLGLPKVGDYEAELLDEALTELRIRLQIMNDWYVKYCSTLSRLNCGHPVMWPKPMSRVDDCAYANF